MASFLPNAIRTLDPSRSGYGTFCLPVDNLHTAISLCDLLSTILLSETNAEHLGMWLSGLGGSGEA